MSLQQLLITASKSQSSSPLLSLPMELLLKIFEYLSGNSANQVCLALACKRLLQTSSLVVIEIPSADKHRHMVPPFCDGMLELMRRMDPVAPGVRRQGAALLCWDCLWYLPINKSYWDKEAEKHATMQSESLVSKGWDWRAWDWEQGASLQCPACWLRELDATATREEDRLLLGL